MESGSIQDIFFGYINQFQFDEHKLDYSKVTMHTKNLQLLSNLGNSGTSIFDLNRKEMIFYSANFGALLGYERSEYAELGQLFFAEKIHPEDAHRGAVNGVSILKLMNSFSPDEKLNHKLISEYRMRNASNRYIRLIEQFQVLELDNHGKIWLMLSIVDVAPNQSETEGTKSKLLNFRTGQMIPVEEPTKLQIELTGREKEILQLVKEGLLSKEISDRLSISLHTVNTHRQRFLEKLGANNSMEAVIFATKYGLID